MTRTATRRPARRTPAELRAAFAARLRTVPAAPVVEPEPEPAGA